jgi:hypothetical protein
MDQTTHNADYLRSHGDKNRLDGRNQIVWFFMVWRRAQLHVLDCPSAAP